MAAPAMSKDASISVTTGQSATVSAAENVPLQYSLILDHLIGDKRQIKDLNPTVMGALPSPQKTEEQKMIERGMESCAFKSLIACVGGNSLTNCHLMLYMPYAIKQSTHVAKLPDQICVVMSDSSSVDTVDSSIRHPS